MDLSMILTIGGASVLTFFASKLLVKGDARVEERRRYAVDLAAWCKANGLPILSQLLSSYAVGDYSGLVHSVGQLRETIADPTTARAVVDNFLNIQLSKKLETAEGKEELIATIEKKLNVTLNREALFTKPVELKKEGEE